MGIEVRALSLRYCMWKDKFLHSGSHFFNISPLDNTIPPRIKIVADYVFIKHSKYFPKSIIGAIFTDPLTRLRDYLLVATGGSVVEEKAGVRINAPFLDFSYSFRLSDFTPIIEAEYLAIILALKKVP